MLPRDERAWYDAFDAYYREHPDRDPSRDQRDTSEPERPNAWEDVPF